jgi:oligopeptide/dipeptide ABC transporter ATP-binding protein
MMATPLLPILTARGIVKRFGHAANTVHAVNSVDLQVAPGEILGLVGESGSGKSTLGRCLLRLVEPTEGSILFKGEDLRGLRPKALRAARADMQMVFQDPWGSLNPRLPVRTLIEEPLKLHTSLDRAARRRKAESIAERVRLTERLLDRYPSDLSGGQLQRVCIARAIATDPKLIILDEPTSSLDVSVRAGILALLDDLRRDLGIAMVFISHDLATLRLISDRVMVLYLGAVVEIGPAKTVFDNPQHPYTAALMSAHLSPNPRHHTQRVMLKGEIPSPVNLPPGCFFASRCPLVRSDCRVARPPLFSVASDHHAACIRVPEHTNQLVLPFASLEPT